jgi:hypothetical protein
MAEKAKKAHFSFKKILLVQKKDFIFVAPYFHINDTDNNVCLMVKTYIFIDNEQEKHKECKASLGF